MTEATAAPENTGGIDFGQALGSLLRRYLEEARAALDHLPGGPRGFHVMSMAAEPVCSNQATIATRLGIDRTVMTYLVDDLEKDELVERRPDPADRRARQVRLTPKGEAVLAESTARIRGVEQRVLGSLTADESEVLRGLVVRAAADEPPVDHTACDAAPLC